MDPVDVEATAMLRTTTYAFVATDAVMRTDSGGATAPPFAPTVLSSWGAPLVLTNALAVGQGVVFDPSSVLLYTDGKVGVEWNSSVGFSTNEVVAHCEGRFGVAVRKPLLIVSVDMSAA